MSQPSPGTIGIQPTGALGVSYYYHLTDGLRREDATVRFVERDGSPSALQLRDHGQLRIQDERGVHVREVRELVLPNLLECQAAGFIPEVLMLCPNPDQLLATLSPCVKLLERCHAVEVLSPGAIPLPILVLCSNGIYFQRVRQVFLEKLEESTLLGRLPDLWPELMPRIIGRMLRGVSIQTGVREGDGAAAVYCPGPRGITRLAGGDTATRERVLSLLAGKGLWVESAGQASPTRAEFDKALVNLVSNLLGQQVSIDASGDFTLLTVGQILERVGEAEIRQLGLRVIQVGKAVRAYGAAEDETLLIAAVMENLRAHASHIPSSLQWLNLRLRRGEPVRGLTPTELWLLDPLIHYARSAELIEALGYFERLKSDLQSTLARARLLPRVPAGSPGFSR